MFEKIKCLDEEKFEFNKRNRVLILTKLNVLKQIFIFHFLGFLVSENISI